MQISVVDVDADGKALATSTTFALCGQVRADGEGDDSLNRLATKAGREFFFGFVVGSCRQTSDWLAVLKNVWSYQK